MTGDGTIKYTYGSNGRLSGVVVGGIATGYRCNGIGQRVAKTGAAGVTVHYVYDEAGQLLGEYDGGGTAIQETVYLGNLPVAVLKPVTNGSKATPAALGINYVYADHLSTPRVLTRASDNKMVWRWDGADPFGLEQPDQNPNRLGDLTYNPRFPGQVFDWETNNHYNYFRNYDPQQGRYLESDPLGLLAGINTYAFVDGRPVDLSDRFGLAPGDTYLAADAAAIQAIRDINAMSIEIDLEIGGRIYRRDDGSFSYTWPELGTRKQLYRVPPACNAVGTNEGIYHTHGAYKEGFLTDIISAGDQWHADHEGVPAFVGTPSGNIQKYTPILGQPYKGHVTQIAKGIR